MTHHGPEDIPMLVAAIGQARILIHCQRWKAAVRQAQQVLGWEET